MSVGRRNRVGGRKSPAPGPALNPRANPIGLHQFNPLYESSYSMHQSPHLTYHWQPAHLLPPWHGLPAHVFCSRTTRFHPSRVTGFQPMSSALTPQTSSPHFLPANPPDPPAPLRTSTLDPKDVENLRLRSRCESPSLQPLTAMPIDQVNRNTPVPRFASAGGMTTAPPFSES